MPELTRVCQRVPENARLCQSRPEYARVSKSMPEYARVLHSNSSASTWTNFWACFFKEASKFKIGESLIKVSGQKSPAGNKGWNDRLAAGNLGNRGIRWARGARAIYQTLPFCSFFSKSSFWYGFYLKNDDESSFFIWNIKKTRQSKQCGFSID